MLVLRNGGTTMDSERGCDSRCERTSAPSPGSAHSGLVLGVGDEGDHDPRPSHRLRYSDDCLNCGRSQLRRFGHREVGGRRCLFCGEDPDRRAARPSVDERQLLRRYLGVLDLRRAAVVRMRWRDDPVTYREIAEILGRSRSGAREVYSSGIRLLRRAAEQDRE